MCEILGLYDVSVQGHIQGYFDTVWQVWNSKRFLKNKTLMQFYYKYFDVCTNTIAVQNLS